MFKEFELVTRKNGYHIIDEDVQAVLRDSGVHNGLCIVHVPHTTLGLVATSSWDEKGIQDGLAELDRDVPARISYRHAHSPFDAAAHTKSCLTGTSRSFIVHEGKIVLGHSQSLMLFEFDGPRRRRYTVTVVARELYYERVRFTTVFSEARDVTESVEQAIRNSGVENGLCHITVVAATAGIVLSAGGGAALEDLMQSFENLVPTRADFRHRETASDCSGHAKTYLAGTQLNLPVVNGKPVLGKGQRLIYLEFDGPRPRDIQIAVYANNTGGTN